MNLYLALITRSRLTPAASAACVPNPSLYSAINGSSACRRTAAIRTATVSHRFRLRPTYSQ